MKKNIPADWVSRSPLFEFSRKLLPPSLNDGLDVLNQLGAVTQQALAPMQAKFAPATPDAQPVLAQTHQPTPQFATPQRARDAQLTQALRALRTDAPARASASSRTGAAAAAAAGAEVASASPYGSQVSQYRPALSDRSVVDALLEFHSRSRQRPQFPVQKANRAPLGRPSRKP